MSTLKIPFQRARQVIHYYKEAPRATFYFSRWVFLRALALLYLVQFFNLGLQATSLIGPNGLTPVSTVLQAEGIWGHIAAFITRPSLLWFNDSSLWIRILWGAGLLTSFAALIGFAQKLAFALSWILYLSLAQAAWSYMNLPWEKLLIEAGFLAIFFSPSHWFPTALIKQSRPSRVFRWLLVFLLFRVMFSFVWVKLTGGDPTWKDLSSFAYHFRSQPIPTWFGWGLSQLPEWLLKASIAGLFAVEPLAPIFIFLWRDYRKKGFAAFALLQVLVFLTGNYGIQCFLVLALSVLILDDFILLGYVPKFFKFKRKLLTIAQDRAAYAETVGVQKTPPVTAIARIIIVTLSLLQVTETILTPPGKNYFPDFLRPLVHALDSWKIINSYEPLVIPSITRYEYVFEVHYPDGTHRELDFAVKPSKLTRVPEFIAPLHLYLDHQVWKWAQLPQVHQAQLTRFLEQLNQGNVHAWYLLSASNDSIPNSEFEVRVKRFSYNFTDYSTLFEKGEWWNRTPVD